MMAKKANTKRRHKYRYILFGTIVLLAGWAAWQCVSHHNPPGMQPAHQLTVMTYNTHRMGGFRKPERNKVLQYLLHQQADVICLQEVEVYHDSKYLTLSELKQTLHDKYPYTYLDFSVHNSRRQYGNAVFSRYPLIHKQTLPYKSVGNLSSRCDVVVGEDTIRLINNHLESNRLTQKDLPEITDNYDGEEIKKKAHNISIKWGKARRLRHEQAKCVRQEIEQSPYPILVVGDFNDIPVSYVYQHISCGMHDAFLETGWGKTGSTYVLYHIGARIDYLLSSKTLIPVSCTTDPTGYSDHYPVTATFGW